MSYPLLKYVKVGSTLANNQGLFEVKAGVVDISSNTTLPNVPSVSYVVTVGGLVINLPNLSSLSTGHWIEVFNTSTGSVVLNTVGGQTIAGQGSSVTINAKSYVLFKKSGATSWVYTSPSAATVVPYTRGFVSSGNLNWDSSTTVSMPFISARDSTNTLNIDLDTTQTLSPVVNTSSGCITTTLTGTISTTTGSSTLTGTGTLFTTQLRVGDVISVSGTFRKITAISSNTAATVDTNYTGTLTNQVCVRGGWYANTTYYVVATSDGTVSNLRADTNHAPFTTLFHKVLPFTFHINSSGSVLKFMNISYTPTTCSTLLPASTTTAPYLVASGLSNTVFNSVKSVLLPERATRVTLHSAYEGTIKGGSAQELFYQTNGVSVPLARSTTKGGFGGPETFDVVSQMTVPVDASTLSTRVTNTPATYTSFIQGYEVSL
jgi:hypothetical protein